jgi:hypothetical protein
MDEESEEHEELVRLIRKIAREEIYSVLDEHLDDYEHKEKPTESADIEAQR